MKISVEWVNHFLSKKLSAREMADALELAAIEVEEISAASSYDSKVVVGRITDVSPHPNADKLKLTRVDVGGETDLEIVCGAPNVAKGLIVPVAQVGAKLPDGMVIKATKIRGEASNGMICSEKELGLSDNHEGIMVLDEGTKIGKKIDDIFTSNDVIDAKTAANRWDLNSVIGVAREVASQTNQSLHEVYPEPIESSGKAIDIKIESEDLCNNFVMARLKVDQSKATPKWLSERLRSSGVRPISIVVDVTNYIMLQYGQPLHAFDASKVSGNINVRTAQPDEFLTTLDGTKRKLSQHDIVIADSEKALGIAGVMGGQNSEIDDKTTEILLEAASFHPAMLRKSAIRHGLRTDASARFERGLPVDLQRRALGGKEKGRGAIGLLIQLANAELLGVSTASIKEPVRSRISADSRRISGLLGIKLDAGRIKTELQKLNFGVTDQGVELVVDVPWWRTDVTLEADITEEVIKLVGHKQLPATIPTWRPKTIEFDTWWSNLWQAKSVLRSLGLFEVTTYSFISGQQIEDIGWRLKDHLKLKNPLSSEQAYLRSSLFPSLLATAAKNRNYSKEFGMFEISKLFHKTSEGELPVESPYLGVILTRPRDAYRAIKLVIDRLALEFNVDLQIEPFVFDPKIAHPTRSAEILIKGERRGIIGQLHPLLAESHKFSGEVGYLELDWDAFVGASRPKASKSISRFPAIYRDLSILADREVTWSKIQAILGEKVEFIGDYYGDDLPEGKKSMTIRFIFNAEDRTLTDKEADSLLKEATNHLLNKISAQVR